MNATPEFIPFKFNRRSEANMMQRAEKFFGLLSQRRTIRAFSDEPVSKGLIETIIKTAGTAPSGAHKQPWKFVVVSDPDLKKQIRLAAEKEERENYERRFPHKWLDDLEKFGTDWHKEFLEKAPWLIVVFKEDYELTSDGKKLKNYYANESVGIACGLLLAAIQNAGLVSLTHTPSPMKFLQSILKRPKNERAFLLIPVGYPAEDLKVPNLKRKPLDEIMRYNV